MNSSRNMVCTGESRKDDDLDDDSEEEEEKEEPYHRLISGLRKKTKNGDSLTAGQILEQYEIVWSTTDPNESSTCVCGKKNLKYINYLSNKKLKPDTKEFEDKLMIIGDVCLQHWTKSKSKIREV